MTAKVRAGLRKAHWRTWHFPVPIEDEATIEAARLRHTQAVQKQAWTVTTESTPAEVKAADDEVAAAKVALDACFDWIELSPLTDDDEMDALIEAHPGDDPKGFNHALLMACLVDRRGMTDDEWLAEVGSWPRPDRNALYAMVREANIRPSYDAVPKG